jgi:hypothetical protein
MSNSSGGRLPRPGLSSTVTGLALLAICAAMGLSGCGASPDPAASPTTSPAGGTATSSSPASPGDVRTISISVTGRTVTPAPARVDLRRGESLQLKITSDHDDELHVHGFEIERKLTAGEPVLVELRGGQPGLYEVETHNPALRLLQIAVR